jgi:hypothetical protein
MRDDVWAAGEAPPATTGSPPAEIKADHEPTDVLSIGFRELQADPWGWAKAGLGFIGPVFGVTMFGVFAMLAAMFGAIATRDESVMLVGQLVGLGIYVLVVLGIVFASPPLFASFLRATDAALRRQQPMSWGAAYTTATTDLGRVLGAQLLVIGITLLGLIACYLPGIAASVVLSPVMALVAVKGMTGMEAVRASWGYATTHTKWFLLHWFLGVILAVAIYYVPCVGLVFIMPFMAIHQILGIRVLELKEGR